MILSTTEELQGFEITEYLGLVSAEIVSGANIVRDVMATVTDFVGGRSAAYEETMQASREAAARELTDRARRMGADGVVGLNLDFEVIGGRGAMLMVSAVGTAVRLRKLPAFQPSTTSA
jgi:uncharacterized protein YbjQ (UPF0145 family)